MGRDVAATLRSLRDDVLVRLVEFRGSINPHYQRLPEDAAREQLDLLLAHVNAWVASGDLAAYEDAIGRWAASRFAEGFGADGVIQALVAVGDAVARIAHDRLGEPAQVAAVARPALEASFVATRLVIAALGDELQARREQLRGLGG